MSRRIALLVLAAALPAVLSAAFAPTGARGDSGRSSDRGALEELGRRLFFDPGLGRQGRIGCASCHDPERGFSDPRDVSVDETGPSLRHSQPLTDLGGEGFHWDGEFETVRDVIDARILPGALPAKAVADRALRRLRAASADREARLSAVAVRAVLDRVVVNRPLYYGTSNEVAVASGPIAERIGANGRYDRGFRTAFGDASVSPARIGDALEAYLATLKTTQNAFDRFLAGDECALSVEARRGRDLFVGKAGCAQCHVAEGPRPTFTDGLFHNTGVEETRVSSAASRRKIAVTDWGRLAASFRLADMKVFKTPGLRDVARRAPYFHDASAATLTDVVRYYDKGGAEDDDLDPRIRPLGLTDREVADIVAFLESLTGHERAGLAARSAQRSPRLSVRVECLDGSPVKGLTVTARPFGDRLAGTSSMPAAVRATTGADGVATFDMPASTHVVVEAEGTARTDPLPDWTSEVCLMFTPHDAIAVTVRFPTAGQTVPDRFAVSESSEVSPGWVVPDGPVFTLVRELGPSEGLYVSSPPAPRTDDPNVVENRPAVLSLDAGEAPEFRPGTHARLDLRPRAAEPDTAVIQEVRRKAREIEELLSAARSVR